MSELEWACLKLRKGLIGEVSEYVRLVEVISIVVDCMLSTCRLSVVCFYRGVGRVRGLLMFCCAEWEIGEE